MRSLPTFQPKMCPTCGEMFIPRSGVQKFCTRSCRPPNRKFVPGPCSVCGEVGRLVKGVCDPHYRQIRTHGKIVREEIQHLELPLIPTYKAVHRRLKKARGSASAWLCVDCGDPALHWAFDNREPKWIDPARGCAYYGDFDRYRPLCWRCHRMTDGLPH